MTLRTWAFAIAFNHSSTPVAHALICPEVTYVGLRWHDGRFDRRHVPASLWAGLDQELSQNLAAGPVSPSSLISTVLVGSMGALMRVSFIEIQTVHAKRKEDLEKALEAATRQSQPVGP